MHRTDTEEVRIRPKHDRGRCVAHLAGDCLDEEAVREVAREHLDDVRDKSPLVEAHNDAHADAIQSCQDISWSAWLTGCLAFVSARRSAKLGGRRH